MFILYVRQGVTDVAFRKQGAKDGVCFTYICYFLHVLVFYLLNTVCCSVATHLTHIRTCVRALNSCYLYTVLCI